MSFALRCPPLSCRTRRALRLIAGVLLASFASTAHAACPMALAVYGERGELAGIDFRPNGDAAAVTNTFKMWVGDGVLLDGIVMWTDEPARSLGMLMHKCPEGDVTGEELAACTLWQGVIYTADGQGNIGLVPKHDKAAPEKLIFPGLGPTLRQSAIFGAKGFTKEPWDVLQLKGCQE